MVLSACDTWTEILQHSPWNRSIGYFTETLFDEILYVLQTNIDRSTYHICFVNFFVQLVSEQPTKDIDSYESNDNKKSTRIKGICLYLASNAAVLETIAILLAPNFSNPEYESSRCSAIHVLQVLLHHDVEKSIKQLMAADDHLLTALVNLCLMSSECSPFKDEVKRIVMTLIPEL
jgi:hypothetical protein